MKHPRGRRGPFAKPAAVLLVLSLALGASAALTGCVGDREAASDQEQLGSLGLNLEVAPGITLHTVTYAITGNGFEKTGSIDAGNSPTISGNIGGIPAGNGYTLELSATSIEAQTVFAGSANFNVAAGQTTSVTVHLTASAGAEDKAGSVASVLCMPTTRRGFVHSTHRRPSSAWAGRTARRQTPAGRGVPSPGPALHCPRGGRRFCSAWASAGEGSGAPDSRRQHEKKARSPFGSPLLFVWKNQFDLSAGSWIRRVSSTPRTLHR